METRAEVVKLKVTVFDKRLKRFEFTVNEIKPIRGDKTIDILAIAYSLES